MAIDSTLFLADIPAGSYAAGDIIQLSVHTGPAVVRDGYGTGVLKRIYTAIMSTASGALSNWRIFVQNSDWIDPMVNGPGFFNDPIGYDDDSACVQSGNNCPLAPNSGWRVWAECISTVTTTVANSMCAVIDIDYPKVSSVADPAAAIGYPTSIIQTVPNVGVNAIGSSATSAWSGMNVDFFKAGYKYLLQKIGASSGGAGFVQLSNAAGMGGLSRIVPSTSSNTAKKWKISYSSSLTKGPMDVRCLLFGASASTTNIDLTFDFVKRRV